MILMCAPYDKKSWFDEFEKASKALGENSTHFHYIFLAPQERELGIPYLEKVMSSACNEMFEKIENEYARKMDHSLTLQDLKIPILNIYGSLDYRVPVVTAHRLKTIQPSVKNFEIEGGGQLFSFFRNKNKSLFKRY